MTPSTHPAHGFLMYGTELIDKDKPFNLLTDKQKQLQAAGLKKALFHKHYYYSETQLIKYLKSLKS